MKDRVHKKHTTKFTTTSNKILQDGRLTYEAIGVFMYLWSMPDDWQIMVRQVMKHNNSTEYKVRQALRELRNYGYIKWKRLQGYCEYDMCEDGSYYCGDIQHDDTQHDDTQHDNIYIQNNNINKTITKTNTASGFSQSENSVGHKLSSSQNENPTVKESLTVQKPKKEEEVEVIPNCIDISKWEEWKNYKKEKKQKLTKSTAGKQLQNLQKWYLEGQDPNEIIDNSISNGWAGLFPLKQQKPTFNNQYAKTKPDYLEVQKRYAATGELQLSTTYRKRRD